MIHNNIPLIRSKPVTFAGWQALNPLGGENDPADNPEGDAWENLEEFAYCFNPRSGVRECALEVIVRPDGTIAACQRRAAGLIGVSFSLAYIEALTDSGPDGTGRGFVGLHGWSYRGLDPGCSPVHPTAFPRLLGETVLIRP